MASKSVKERYYLRRSECNNKDVLHAFMLWHNRMYPKHYIPSERIKNYLIYLDGKKNIIKTDCIHERKDYIRGVGLFCQDCNEKIG